MGDNSASAVSDLEKCEMLNSFFSSSFNYSVASIPECSCGMLSSVSCPDGLLCTEDDVLRLIGVQLNPVLLGLGVIFNCHA